MFTFFSRKQKSIGPIFERFGVDIHNHLLPGIDDGCPDSKASIELIEGLSELGFKKFICTPHTLDGLYPNTPQTIEDAYNHLISDIPESYSSKNFGFASEYMVDYFFEGLLKEKKLLTLGNSAYVLIEMSYLAESVNIRQMIFDLQTSGYFPILAHPERYGYYHHQQNTIYEELVDAGCDLQVNLPSLAGHYGSQIQSVAIKLINRGLISWVGTDIHHSGHLESMRKLANNKKGLAALDRIKNPKNSNLF